MEVSLGSYQNRLSCVHENMLGPEIGLGGLRGEVDQLRMGLKSVETVV